MVLRPSRLLVTTFLLVLVVARIDAKSFLITGGAGFIGFHTGIKLAENKKNSIVALDIFDDSYNVHLKKVRADILNSQGITIHKGDVCSQQMLEHLFDAHNFSHVVHLSAKEDHQKSMEDPRGFIKANVECLLTLLKILARHKETHLVFLSSYNILDQANNGLTPAVSLYTSLKTAAERLVAAYCHDYGIKAVGIRPFSVYGPFGRPDGDIYRMALEIMQGTPVQVYVNQHSSTVASRDYTFVDDVVIGVILAMNHQPNQCGETYNIGSGAEPVSMKKAFLLLKQEMEKPAEMKLIALPKYEPLVTKADITQAIVVLKYKPAVTIEKGIREFVNWFKEYQKIKNERHPADPYNSLSERLNGSKVRYLNDKYKTRIMAIRKEYEKKAVLNNLPVAKYYHKEFIKFESTNSNNSAKRIPQYQIKGSSVSELKYWCQLIDECIAFDSKGRLYGHIPQRKNWRYPSKDTDFYVANIDVCKAGITSCYGECTCNYTGPSQSTYGCKEGFGVINKSNEQNFCYELYVNGKQTWKEKEFRILDEMEGRDWDSFIRGKEYVCFNNTSVGSGVVAYYPEAAGNIEKLKDACDNTYHCMGFSTNGELKGIIDHVHRWKPQKHGDLYVRDVDYCNMHDQKCDCKKVAPAKYVCEGRKISV